MTGHRLELSRTRDGIYLVHAADGRLLGSFYAESDGWWTAFPANGVQRRLYEPCADPAKIARRLFAR
ncbi:hypothetical protein [Actinomadura hibisca]|uniref:hypothetical protein n=1 Tax=Actinomadura hibisca TaxID=68565 RepID=UPI0012FA2B95|nr:hypothetical protein [Actinomadura hibisca]